MQRFSSDWHANSFAGATVRKITRGMTAFDTFTDTLMFGLVPAFVVVTGVTAVFAVRWPILGLVVGVSILVFLVVVVTLAIYWIRPANVEAREWDSKMSGVLADSITGNAVVKSFAAEEREDAQFADVARNWEWRAVRGTSKLQPTPQEPDADAWLWALSQRVPHMLMPPARVRPRRHQQDNRGPLPRF